MVNPLTFIIDQARELLVWGHLPDWLGLGVPGVYGHCLGWFCVVPENAQGVC